MIKKEFLFPHYYVHKIPYCDDCNIKLVNMNQRLLSYPPMDMYKCKQCGKEYTFNVNDLQGEWRWRTI